MLFLLPNSAKRCNTCAPSTKKMKRKKAATRGTTNSSRPRLPPLKHLRASLSLHWGAEIFRALFFLPQLLCSFSPAPDAIRHPDPTVRIPRQRESWDRAQPAFDDGHPRKMPHLILCHRHRPAIHAHGHRLFSDIQDLQQLPLYLIEDLVVASSQHGRVRCPAQEHAQQCTTPRDPPVEFFVDERDRAHPLVLC